MADNDNIPPVKQSNLAVETKRLIFEITIILESIAAGLEALQKMSAAAPVLDEIDVLRAFVSDLPGIEIEHS